MESYSKTSDEIIRLTNKLGVEVRDLQYQPSTEMWYFKMIVTQFSKFVDNKASVSIYQISHFDEETWVSSMMSDEDFNALLNG